MKKSEMVNKILELTDNYFPISEGDIHKVLTLAEKLGMEPPIRTVYVKADEYGEGFYMPENSWEPEDEEK